MQHGPTWRRHTTHNFLLRGRWRHIWHLRRGIRSQVPENSPRVSSGAASAMRTVDQWNFCGQSSLTAPRLRRYRLRAEMATENPISGGQCGPKPFVRPPEHKRTPAPTFVTTFSPPLLPRTGNHSPGLVWRTGGRPDDDDCAPYTVKPPTPNTNDTMTKKSPGNLSSLVGSPDFHAHGCAVHATKP